MRLGLVISIIGQLLVSFSFAYLVPVLMCLWDGDFNEAGHYAWLVSFISSGFLASRGFQRPRVLYRPRRSLWWRLHGSL